MMANINQLMKGTDFGKVLRNANRIPFPYTAVFGCSNKYAADLSHLTPLDVSDKQDGSILFYANPQDQTVYILADGLICAHEDASFMFQGCPGLHKIVFENFDTSCTTNMKGIFSDSELKHLDLSSFDTRQVTDLSSMFDGARKLVSVNLSSFCTDQVSDLSHMFYGCESLQTLDLSGFKTENVTSMMMMFSGCEKLEQLDLRGFHTNSLTQMAGMFVFCRSLEQLDLSSFDVSKVSSMSNLFHGCNSLKSLNLSGWDTRNVTNMREMFCWCNSLKQLELSSFNTSEVTDMARMFYACQSLEQLDVSGFKTDNLTTMAGMFDLCLHLQEPDLSAPQVDEVLDAMEQVHIPMFPAAPEEKDQSAQEKEDADLKALIDEIIHSDPSESLLEKDAPQDAAMEIELNVKLRNIKIPAEPESSEISLADPMEDLNLLEENELEIHDIDLELLIDTQEP